MTGRLTPWSLSATVGMRSPPGPCWNVFDLNVKMSIVIYIYKNKSYLMVTSEISVPGPLEFIVMKMEVGISSAQLPSNIFYQSKKDKAKKKI